MFLYHPYLLSNNLFHKSGILAKLQLQVLTFRKYVALRSRREINEVNLLAVLARVIACPYYSIQAINRQKPVTHLIKFKSSSCQTLCLALPSLGPNGCLWSIMPRMPDPLCQLWGLMLNNGASSDLVMNLHRQTKTSNCLRKRKHLQIINQPRGSRK